MLKVMIGMVAVLALLLSMPAVVQLQAGEGVRLRFRYLFLSMRLYPADSKKEKSGKKKKMKSKKAEERKATRKKTMEEKVDGFLDILEVASSLLYAVAKPLQRMLRRVSVCDIKLEMTVAKEDAHQTAVQFGRANLCVYAALAALQTIVRVKVESVAIRPDFTEGESGLRLSLKARVTPGTLLRTGLWILWRFLVNFVKKKLPSGGAEKNKMESGAA